MEFGVWIIPPRSLNLVWLSSIFWSELGLSLAIRRPNWFVSALHCTYLKVTELVAIKALSSNFFLPKIETLDLWGRKLLKLFRSQLFQEYLLFSLLLKIIYSQIVKTRLGCFNVTVTLRLSSRLNLSWVKVELRAKMNFFRVGVKFKNSFEVYSLLI